MKNKILYVLIGAAIAIGGFGFYYVANAATTAAKVNVGGTGLTAVKPGFILFGGTTATANLATSTGLSFNVSGNRLTIVNGSSTVLSATTFCLTGDTCRTTWPTSGGGGGSGSVGTSTADVAGQVTFFSSNSATPALIAGNSAFTFATSPGRLTIPYASTTVLSATTLYGALIGNSSTATALAANGTNCSAGNYPLGVDASGNAESCTAAGTGTVTGVTGGWPILSSGGATPNITWGGIATSSNIAAASGFLYATGVNTFASVATSSPLSMSISGNAATVTTNANLTGVVTSVGNATSFAASPTFSGTVTGTSFSGAGTGLTGTASSLNIGGNAATVTTNANLSGVITSVGNTTSYGSQAAGVLGNPATGNTAVQATSTLYGAVQPGKVLAGANGALQYVATTTMSCSSGVTCTFSGGNEAFSIAAGAITNTMLASTYMTSVAVASSNGFAGSSSGGATPTITLTTSITGVLKGNGTAISAASNGTDYSLITANTCGAGQFFNAATAAGIFSCGTPSAGGGSSGGTWATTTSLVAGELVNHPNNNSDVVVVGAAATTSAPFFIDPNPTAGPFFGIGSTSPFAQLSIHLLPTNTFNATAFAIGSSTNSATTTLFSINNVGSIFTQLASGIVSSVSGVLSNLVLSAGLSQSGNTLSQVENRGFSVATTTAWTGTTTVALGVGYGEVWNNIKCYTNTGTLAVDFYHASTHFNFIKQASTTIGTNSMSGATDTTGDKVQVDIGTPASSPTSISCTVNDTN